MKKTCQFTLSYQNADDQVGKTFNGIFNRLLVTAFSGKNILNSNKDHLAAHRKQDSVMM